MKEWRYDRIGAAERGENPMVLARMQSGFAIFGDTQFLPGYCLLIASPQVGQLTDLAPEQQVVFLRDMSLLGMAVGRACNPRRINYEILGNSWQALHAHVWARYNWEPEAARSQPIWLYPQEYRYAPEQAFNEEKHGALKDQIAHHLQELLAREKQ
ncbi:MAG: DeoR family transcriptional regulator [Ktedonobacteraceae bacterium]